MTMENFVIDTIKQDKQGFTAYITCRKTPTFKFRTLFITFGKISDAVLKQLKLIYAYNARIGLKRRLHACEYDRFTTP